MQTRLGGRLLGVVGAPLATVLTAAGLGLLAAPRVARASGTIQIEFDFSFSSVSIGGEISVPPDGALLSSFARIDFPGDGFLTPVTGRATLHSLTVDATISQTLPIGTVTGLVFASQVGPWTGMFSAAGGHLALAQSLPLWAFGVVVCNGPCSGPALPLPLSQTGTQTLSGPFSLNLGGLTATGMAYATGALTWSLDGETVMVDLVGLEISRTYTVPEPSRALGVAGGVAGLLVLARLRRRGDSARAAPRGASSSGRSGAPPQSTRLRIGERP